MQYGHAYQTYDAQGNWRLGLEDPEASPNGKGMGFAEPQHVEHLKSAISSALQHGMSPTEIAALAGNLSDNARR